MIARWVGLETHVLLNSFLQGCRACHQTRARTPASYIGLAETLK